MIESILTPQIFAFLLVFCRIGAGVMLMPGFGEAYISPTIRLAFALLVALIMATPLVGILPPAPSTPLALGQIVAAEILAGAFIGLLCRALLSALHTAGTIVSMQSGLSAAMMFDMTQASQGTLIGNLFSMSGLAFWFAMDFHHLMLQALFDSYTMFSPGAMFPMGDGVNMYAHLMGSCFSIALQITAPIVLVMLLVNLGGGILSRLMPAMQVFYLLLPLQLLITFFLLKVMSNAFFTAYLAFAESQLTGLLQP